MISYEYFDTYFDYVWDNTECPRIYHRWCAISAISALLGRQVWYKLGHKNIFPNHMVKLIGPPATRKSSAIDVCKIILKGTGYTTFAGQRTSKEKFLQELADRSFGQDSDQWINNSDDFTVSETEAPSEVFICSGEFNTFAGTGNIEFLSILGDLYDNPDDFEVRNKISKSGKAIKPTINLLGGNTQQNLASCMPPEMIGQGFMSRLILVYASDKQQSLFDPPDADAELESKLVDMLLNIKLNMTGRITATDEAKQLLKLLYEEQDVWVEDSRFVYYNGRRYTHLLKLCMIIAVSRLSMQIEPQDVLYANSILTHTEIDMPKCLGEFGRAKNADLVNRIMAIMLEAPKQGGYSPMEMFKKVHQDCNSQQEVVQIFSNLSTAGKIIKSSIGGGWIAVKKDKKKIEGIIDFSLLRESDVTKHVMEVKTGGNVITLR